MSDDAIKEAADNARELTELRRQPTVGLNRPPEDVLGRPLPDDPAAAREQRLDAVALRDQRIAVDVARTQRGLPTKYATK